MRAPHFLVRGFLVKGFLVKGLVVTMIVLVVPVVGVLGACGDDEPNDAGAGGATLPEPYTLETVCDAYVSRTCAALEGCCEIAGLSFEPEGCQARQRAVCENYVERTEQGELTFDPTQVDACLEELEHVYGVCEMAITVYAFELIDITNTCAAMIHGHVGPGEPCANTVDCEPAAGHYSFCNDTTMVCERLRARQAGESCGPSDFCVASSYCDASATCQRHPGIGDPCDPVDDLSCGMLRHCDDATMVCTASKGGGEDCTAGVECASLVCDTVCAPVSAVTGPMQCSASL